MRAELNRQGMLSFKTPDNVGRSIAEARRNIGLTQEGLCQKIDISYSTLTKIERGAIKSPNAYTLAKIATVCRTTVEALLALGNQASAGVDWESGATSQFGVRFVFINFNSLLAGSLQSALDQIKVDFNLSQKQVDDFFYKHYRDLSLGNLSLVDFNQTTNSHLGLNGFEFGDYLAKEMTINQTWIPVLNWISEHYLVGLIVNGSEKLVENRRLFNFPIAAIVASSSLKMSWPNKPFLEIAQTKASPAQPGQILLIDDKIEAISQAANFGWQCLLVNQSRLNPTIDKIRWRLDFDNSKIKQ